MGSKVQRSMCVTTKKIVFFCMLVVVHYYSNLIDRGGEIKIERKIALKTQVSGWVGGSS